MVFLVSLLLCDSESLVSSLSGSDGESDGDGLIGVSINRPELLDGFNLAGGCL